GAALGAAAAGAHVLRRVDARGGGGAARGPAARWRGPRPVAGADRPRAQGGTLMDALLVLWWKAAVVLAAGAVVSLAAWRASAATRHLIWTAALAGALLLPLASAVLPAVRVAALPALVNAVHQPALVPLQASAPSPAPVAGVQPPPVNSVHFTDAPVNA